eukprot:PhF_6_TR4979/c0_g1_i1/m.7046
MRSVRWYAEECGVTFRTSIKVIPCNCFGLQSLVTTDEPTGTQGVETCAVQTETNVPPTPQLGGRSVAHQWESVPCKGSTFPSPRSGHALSVVVESESNDSTTASCYLFGGMTSTPCGRQDILLSDLWKLELNTMTWSRLECRAGRPAPRYGHTMVAVDHHRLLVMFGGITLITPTRCAEDVWIYNIMDMTWTKSPSQGYGERWGHTATMYQEEYGKMSHVRGCDVLDDPNSYMIVLFGECYDGSPAPPVTIFNPIHHEWHQINAVNCPPNRRRHCTTFSPDKASMIVFGGRCHETTYNDTWTLQLGSWVFRQICVSVVPGTPTPRTGHCAVQVGNKVYTFGGFQLLDDQSIVGSAPPSVALHNDVHVLDVTGWHKVTPQHSHPATDIKRVLSSFSTATLPPEMSMAASFYFQGKMYIHGGRTYGCKAVNTLMALPVRGDVFSNCKQGSMTSLRFLVAQYMVDNDICRVVPAHLRAYMDKLFRQG